MNKDIKEVLLTEEVLAEKIKEIGAKIIKEYAGKRFNCTWDFKRISNIHGRFNERT